MPTPEAPETADDAALKRLAMGVFLQLPTNLAEAEQVLAYCREILKWHQGVPYHWAEGPRLVEENPDVLAFTKRG